ncbi:alpha amylase catalytic region [Xylanimonas cellulosilytica DSM 15894]|uniref:Alpha amylase catalytic region n=1 Tax=Xylanimonas cellulosilytica (strain DSM 15894 / JCM 12276 / CECT 5975 / KCTC 9989 / LMG 20990 / NBRC 107835 / XIL07) TaxID=446471 RepID=D1BUG4_XYLCX|nr:glycoside hydrolase family 13 protein [Xylanimonas cellulosilytica]ACZ31177.1 alpha amylase catalytic region [Xylanimonas cellulosilytica DSM 15894]
MGETTAGARPATGHLLDTPHHDGSALYVPPGPHAFGDVVPVRVRVPRASGVRGVWLRQVRDGEPRTAPARVVESDDVRGHDVYEADVVVHSAPTTYRFLLDQPGLPGGYAWLNGEGVHAREVADAHDFRLTTASPAPAWLAAGTVYQIFPDRFARSAAADGRELPDWALPATWEAEPVAAGTGVGTQLYGGDLDGVVEHLDHLESLGVRTVYLCPVFPGRSNHRYDASTFDHVDPLLGGDAAYARLAEAVHARGMRLMGDITTNHTGAGHDWFTRAQADPTSDEHAMFMWAGEGSVPAAGADIDPDVTPAYVSWLGHASLPKLDWRSPEVWRRMVDAEDSAIARWMRPPYDLDGWRVDVANMTGRYGPEDSTTEVARRIRQRMLAIDPEAAVIGEHFFDYTADLPGDGWHGAMNYSGFSRPVWGWLADPGSGLEHVSVPLPRRPQPGRAVAATMRDFTARVPWQIAAAQLNNLGSHDTARLRNAVGSPQFVELGAALLFTYPGVPMLFAGDEVGLRGTNGEHARVTMAWDQAATGGPKWDGSILDVFRGLSTLRGTHPALATGGIRWAVADDDALAYLRESPDETLLVVVARAPWSGVTLPGWIAQGGEPELLYGGGLVGTPTLAVDAAGVRLGGDGPAVGIWRIAP